MKAVPRRVKKGSAYYFKAVAISIMAWLKVKRQIEVMRLDQREVALADLAESMKLY